MADTTYIRYVNLKNDTILGVGKFTILWNVYEDEKCDCCCTYDKILKSINNIGNKSKTAFIQLAAELKTRAKNDNSIDDYVSNKLYPTGDNRARISRAERTTYITQVFNFINSNGNDFFDGGLLAIWRIRNNMFHGLKGHSVLEEQIDLFKAMCDVLEAVIDE